MGLLNSTVEVMGKDSVNLKINEQKGSLMNKGDKGFLKMNRIVDL